MPHNNMNVTHDDVGIRLDRFFKRHHPNTPFANIAKLIRLKKITVNGKRAEISQRLEEGDLISHPNFVDIIEMSEDRPFVKNVPNAMIERLKDAVIFQDDNIIAINKPAGLAVQGGSRIVHSIDELSSYLQDEAMGKPKLVHRIDKNTTGIVILARSAHIASKISEIIKRRQIRKTYIALCKGAPKLFEGTIDTPLPSHHSQIDDGKEVKMRKAITHYRVIDKAYNQYSLLELEIPTGRNHQIRIHLASINCQVIGDKKYGSFSEIQRNIPNKMYLHAHTLSFEMLGIHYNLVAPLPPHFNEALKLLELSDKNITYT